MVGHYEPPIDYRSWANFVHLISRKLRWQISAFVGRKKNGEGEKTLPIAWPIGTGFCGRIKSSWPRFKGSVTLSKNTELKQDGLFFKRLCLIWFGRAFRFSQNALKTLQKPVPMCIGFPIHYSFLCYLWATFFSENAFAHHQRAVIGKLSSTNSPPHQVDGGFPGNCLWHDWQNFQPDPVTQDVGCDWVGKFCAQVLFGFIFIFCFLKIQTNCNHCGSSKQFSVVFYAVQVEELMILTLQVTVYGRAVPSLLSRQEH